MLYGVFDPLTMAMGMALCVTDVDSSRRVLVCVCGGADREKAFAA